MLSSTVDRVSYTGANSTAVYSYGCRIFASSDIKATVRKISDGTETLLVLTTDYTVASIGLATGNITLVNASQAWLDGSGNLSSSYKLVIRRVRPLTQNASIRNQGTFYGSVHEDVFDNQTMVSQQQEDEISRSVKLSETVTSSDFDPTLPVGINLAANAKRTLVVNDTNNGLSLGPTTDTISGATTAAAAAASSATDAASSATSAATSATNAAASATAAASSATAAATSATAAAASAAAAVAAAIVTGTRASPQSITAAGGIAFTGSSPSNVWFIKGSGGAVTVTKNPQIAAGSVTGQYLDLFATDDTNTVTVADGTGLDLNGPWTGGNGSRLSLMWDGSNWSEVSRR